MSTPRYFTLIWGIFHLFAVQPHQKPSETPASRVTRIGLIIWRCFLILVLGLLAFYTYLKRESVLYSKDMIGHVNDFVKYVGLFLCSLVVMLETFAKRSSHAIIWKLVECVRQFLKLSDVTERECNQHYAIKFWLCFTLFVAVEIRVATATLANNDAQWFQAWAVGVLPLMICRMMCFLHIYYIDLLAAYFRYLQRELEAMVKFSEYSLHAKHNRSVMKRQLAALKDVYGLLFQASVHVNTVFAWSQAFNFTRIFLQNICDLHWIYLHFEYEFPILVSNFIPAYTCFLLVLRAANRCLGVVKALTPLVYQIRYAAEERALERLILMFSVQLSHEAVSFSGNSLYTIDYGLLRAMITGIIGYMIIIVQMTSKK